MFLKLCKWQWQILYSMLSNQRKQDIQSHVVKCTMCIWHGREGFNPSKLDQIGQQCANVGLSKHVRWMTSNKR